MGHVSEAVSRTPIQLGPQLTDTALHDIRIQASAGVQQAMALAHIKAADLAGKPVSIRDLDLAHAHAHAHESIEARINEKQLRGRAGLLIA
jgi:hypothetical protein